MFTYASILIRSQSLFIINRFQSDVNFVVLGTDSLYT